MRRRKRRKRKEKKKFVLEKIKHLYNIIEERRKRKIYF